MTEHDRPGEEGHNGWANRETWALALHLDNDQGLYSLARDIAYDSIHAAHEQLDADETELLQVRTRAESITADKLREQIDEWAQDVQDAATSGMTPSRVPEPIAALIHEIGSRWRIDWRALAVGYVEERWTDYCEAHDR